MEDFLKLGAGIGSIKLVDSIISALLHCAVRAVQSLLRPVTGSDPALVRALLEQFPAHISNKEMKLGGSPAHWATEKPLLDGMLSQGCDLEARNSTGATPLHIMARAKRLACVVCLLSNGAQVDHCLQPLNPRPSLHVP